MSGFAEASRCASFPNQPAPFYATKKKSLRSFAPQHSTFSNRGHFSSNRKTNSAVGDAYMTDGNDVEEMDGDDVQLNWKDWFETHGPRLLLFARQQTRSLQDAEDTLQDAVIRQWKKGDSGGIPPLWRFFATIRRTAIDQARRETRRLRREEQSVELEETAPILFESTLEERERTGMIEAAIRRLPGPQHEVVTLKVWGELTFEEIAAALEISPNTAASRYRYALGNLRKQLHLAQI